MTTNGKEQELGNRRAIFTDSLAKFEENCHPDREEHLFFGEQNDIRIIGSYCDRNVDTKTTSQHATGRLYYTKKLNLSKLTKPTQAKIIEASAETTTFFDCAIDHGKG